MHGKLQGEVKSESAERDELVGDGEFECVLEDGRIGKERSRRVMTTREAGS